MSRFVGGGLEAEPPKSEGGGLGPRPLGLRKENQSWISRPKEKGTPPFFHLLRGSKEKATGSAAD